MEALLPALLAALLAEIGDKTQLLALLLAARFRNDGAVLAGIAVAALANSALASFGGVLIAQLITFRAVTMLLALALLFAGAGALLPQRAPTLSHPRRAGAFLSSAIAFFILEFGDKTQFLTTALSARAHSAPLTALGATLGIVLANAPAVMLKDGFARFRPQMIRRGVGILFLVIAAATGLHALRLL